MVGGEPVAVFRYLQGFGTYKVSVLTRFTDIPGFGTYEVSVLTSPGFGTYKSSGHFSVVSALKWYRKFSVPLSYPVSVALKFR